MHFGQQILRFGVPKYPHSIQREKLGRVLPFIFKRSDFTVYFYLVPQKVSCRAQKWSDYFKTFGGVSQGSPIYRAKILGPWDPQVKSYRPSNKSALR